MCNLYTVQLIKGNQKMSCKGIFWQHLLFLFPFISLTTSSDVRLIRGSTEYEGNVQVRFGNGEWLYVLDDDWDFREAQVVCRQLGFSTTNVISRTGSYYGYGNGSLWTLYPSCSGYENRLLDCSLQIMTDTVNYGYDEIAGIACFGEADCTNGDIRLTQPNSDTNVVEVCSNNEWGTVCSNGWDSNDATVACKQLGYTGFVNWRTYFGSGQVLLTELACNSSHTSLFDCPHSTDTSSCFNIISISCYSIDNSSCSDGDVKLRSVNVPTPDNEGIILVCINGTWYPMDEQSDCHSKELACRAAGYDGLELSRSQANMNYGYHSAGSMRYQFTCAANATHLTNCSREMTDSISASSFGGRCHNDVLSKCSIEGSVRLVNGTNSREGRAEYCYNNEWVPMCNINQYTGVHICQKLGYTNANLVFFDNVFGKSDSISDFNSLDCTSSSTSLSQCTNVTSSSCGAEPKCYIHYGLRCYDHSVNECTDGDVRLVDGHIEQEGRPEVCVNGLWSQICGRSWAPSSAYMFCLAIGYNGSAAPSIYNNVSPQFGIGQGPIVWDAVFCQFWDTIHSCAKSIHPSFYCDTRQIAGVRCTEGCSDGDVRLVGGTSVNEGTVEVCYDELWGLISGDGWSDNEAIVVCRQLGYDESEVHMSEPLLQSHFGRSFRKAVHLSRVECMGSEPNISNCSLTRDRLESTYELSNSVVLEWANVTVASVRCYPLMQGNDSTDACVAKCDDRQTTIIVGTISGSVLFLVIIIVIAVIVMKAINHHRQGCCRFGDKSKCQVNVFVATDQTDQPKKGSLVKDSSEMSSSDSRHGNHVEEAKKEHITDEN